MGGACPPRLPPEAELRLLKQLQQAVNKSTKTIDSQPQKDKPKLVALGGRQGELRNLLDQVIQKASGGAYKLGKEPDNKDQLPEEAKKEDVENQELENDLLGKPEKDLAQAEEIEKFAGLVGDRMARSRQRLALNTDPGKVTQLIQDRIVTDLDKMIEEARKQECNGSGAGQKKPQNPGQNKQAQPANPVAQKGGKGVSKPNRGSSPAGVSSAPGAADQQVDISQQIKETAEEWGKISPRLRDAVIEGASEKVIEKYRKLTDDYTKAVSTEATGQQK